MSVALALAALITLAWLHELGHALAARALHLHVTAVSFGLGPPLGQVRWGDTRILLGLIPFGGYVRVAELVEESGAGNPARPGLAARLAVILAGPLANYAVAVLLGEHDLAADAAAGFVSAMARIFAWVSLLVRLTSSTSKNSSRQTSSMEASSDASSLAAG